MASARGCVCVCVCVRVGSCRRLCGAVPVRASGRARSFEALFRWNHPVRGLVPPLDFIPMAEEIGLLDGGQSQAIGLAVLAMARSLGMRVTAEGVETLAQAQALKAMACDCLQGFYFSRPVPAAGVAALLSRHWALESTQPA